MNGKKEPSSVVELQKLYQSLSADIASAVENKGAGTVKAYEKVINEKLREAMATLNAANLKFSYEELPKGFERGKQDAESRFGKDRTSGEETKSETRKGAYERKTARKILDEQGFTYGGKALSRDTYIELQSATIAAGKDFQQRINGVIGRLEKEGKNTLGNVREAMVEDMRNNGILAVEYKNGAKMPLEAYASMAARTARTESVNLGSIGWSLENGINYVKMSEVFPTCPVCARFQGRVYCVDGKDSRFTALFGSDGPLSRGYASVHPHCRHQFLPYNFKFHTEAEIAGESKRSLNLSTATADEKNRKAYAAWQAGNRQRNTEMQDYAAMKAYYKSKGIQPPYATLGAYRREARKPKEEWSSTFNAWHNRKKDQLQYEEWKSIIGKKNMPETLEKFQKIKYNKKEEFDLLKGYKAAQEKRDIDALVSFDVYKQVSREIDKEIVGKTFEGIEIKGKKTHFIDRVIGQYQESDYPQPGKRQGVKIEDIVDALKNPVKKVVRVNPDGMISLSIFGKICRVVVNPETGMLIQTNKKHGDK